MKITAFVLFITVVIFAFLKIFVIIISLKGGIKKAYNPMKELVTDESWLDRLDQVKAWR